jgi:predicted dehydrogenase
VSALRIGIVGARFAAELHATNYRPLLGPRVELAAVCSRTRGQAEDFARRHAIPRVFSDYRALVESPDVDVVDICATTDSHHEIAVAAARAGKHVIVEKPLTGFFGSPREFTKRQMLDGVATDLISLREAFRSSGVTLGYAENFVYAPSVQKEREIVEKTRAQILRLVGEESHNGSHSPVYGIWSIQGGGSLIAKGCHPLGAVLYLKRKEGLARLGRPIRPAFVSARTHSITRIPGFEDKGFIRTKYEDTEDYSLLHVVFDDGTVGDITASELVMGGIYDFIEVFANNHRTRCRMSPVNVIDVYNPRHEQMKDVYLVEKISTNEGWIPASPEEGWSLGYGRELRDFVTAMRNGRAPESDLDLATDITLTLYAGYVSADDKGREVEVPHL